MVYIETGFEQALIVCNPPLMEKDLSDIYLQLKKQCIFVIHAATMSSEKHASLQQMLESKETNKYSVLICESDNCIEKLQLMIGTANFAKIIQQHKNESDYNLDTIKQTWYCKYQESNYNWYLSTDTTDSSVKIKTIFVDPFKLQQTLAIIKPTAMRNGYKNDIVSTIESNGFTIAASKVIQQLKPDYCKEFYAEHQGKPFLNNLVEFMSSGPICVMILEKISAIKCWRTLIGPTNNDQAKKDYPSSIRARFGTNSTENACHGSDSTQSAKREINFFFPEITMPLTDEEKQNTKHVVESYMNQKLSNHGMFTVKHSDQ